MNRNRNDTCFAVALENTTFIAWQVVIFDTIEVPWIFSLDSKNLRFLRDLSAKIFFLFHVRLIHLETSIQ